MPNFTYAAFSEVRASKLGPGLNAPGLACRGASLYGRIKARLVGRCVSPAVLGHAGPHAFFPSFTEGLRTFSTEPPGRVYSVGGPGSSTAVFSHDFRSPRPSGWTLPPLSAARFARASCALLFSCRSAGPRALWRAGLSLLVPIHSSAWKRSVLRS